MNTGTAAAATGTFPLSPSFLGTEPSMDFLGGSRKRKVSETDDLAFLQSPPLSTENSANENPRNNGTLTAQAQPGGLCIKIRRTTPRLGVPTNTYPQQENVPSMPMIGNPIGSFPPFPPMMPPNQFMGNPMGMSFPTNMNSAMYPPLGMPPPPQSLSLVPQHSLMGNEGGQDLGPPPPAPPRMAVEHSLMGGGIELQQPVRNVDTRNFDWNRRSALAQSSDDEHGDGGRPRSGSLPNISVGLLDGLGLQRESSFFKEV